MKKSILKVVSLLLAAAILVCSMTVAMAEEPAENDAAPYRISITVNGDTASERGFTWYTKTECDSLLEISCDDAKITYDDVFEWEGSYCHKAKVTNLPAGGTFTYTVGSTDVRSAEGKFTTDNADDKVNFIAIADVQAGNDDNFRKGADTLYAGLKTLPDADFIANMGDFTNDSDNEEWNFYDKNFKDINANTTLAPVAGNHDGFSVWHWFANMFNLDTSESVQNLNGVNYSFDYGNAHFAVLNTNDLMALSLSQLRWLKNDMNSTDKDWKIILMHKSPYTYGKDGKWPDALYLQRSLTLVCDMCDVDLVLCGHDHQYLRTKPMKMGMVNDDGTTYILSGTAGSKRYEIRKFLYPLFQVKNNIAAMTIQKDGYGNYWNGESWDETKETNVGGCFNTIQIDGGTLTFNSYILSDTLVDEATGERLITNADTYTITKETGKNKATFKGDNTTSELEYYLGVIPSVFAIATYIFIEWLPKFLINIPSLAYIYITEDTF